MSQFLQDQHIINLSLNKNALEQINELFVNFLIEINSKLKDDELIDKAVLTYVIRFDNKGYRVFTWEILLQYFHRAKHIERIFFTLETGKSVRSQRSLGTCIELKLDQNNSDNCWLFVTSDDDSLVISSFSALCDILKKYKNRNGLARTTWIRLGIEIFGIIFGFILSLWAALKVSPKLTIENSFVICFLFMLLIFSNTWTYFNQKIILFINRLFPNLKFYRAGKDRMHWFMQSIVGGFTFLIALYILNRVFSFVGDILSYVVKQ